MPNTLVMKELMFGYKSLSGPCMLLYPSFWIANGDVWEVFIIIIKNNQYTSDRNVTAFNLYCIRMSICGASRARTLFFNVSPCLLQCFQRNKVVGATTVAPLYLPSLPFSIFVREVSSPNLLTTLFR